MENGKSETSGKDEKGEKGTRGGRKEIEKSDEGLLIIKDQLDREVQFKIQKSTPLRKLMDAYCSRFGLQVPQVRFMVDGARVFPEDTAEQLGLESEDHIDVAMEQTGGAGSTDGMSTGLSQDFSSMDVSQAHAEVRRNSMTTTPPPGLAAPQVQVPLHALKELVESETLRHFELTQATDDARKEPTEAIVSFPKDWLALVSLLSKLAYSVEAHDPWATLGFGPFSGPEITELDISSRSRTGRILCSLDADSNWTAEDQDKAMSTAEKLEIAEKYCEE